MRRAVRAIIIKDDSLLVMQRNKFGTVYDTLPGGNIEVGETPEQALYREVEEETMVQFKNPKLVFIEHSDAIYGDQYVFLCEYVSGEPQLHPDAEEQHINKLGKNLYQPAWLDLDKLPDAPFLSDKLQQKIIECHRGGWPEKVQEFTSTRNV
jgi:ADP-ribose pyrophosphatase YjhB (NUDIX family)